MIEKAIQLYEMMAARFEETGWSPCQAAVYAEMAEFMRKECSSLEDATEKIKNSHLYTAASVALVKDKINAYIRAAEDDEIEGMAEVYRQKLDEIERDPTAIYDSAYFTTAHNIYVKHFSRIYAFQDIYQCYLDMERNYEFSGERFEIVHLPLRMAFEQLERYEGNFTDCANRPEFREVIPVGDEAYRRFVRDALHYRSNPPDPAMRNKEARKRVDEVWSRFNNEDIKQKITLLKGGCGACLMIAPPDEHGDYEYTEIVSFQNQ